MTMSRFELSRIFVLWLLVATMVASQESPNTQPFSERINPNLQTFSERTFGQRAPDVFRTNSHPPRFAVVLGHVRSQSSNLRAALATSCNIYQSLCLVEGRYRSARFRETCVASSRRCLNSIERSVLLSNGFIGRPILIVPTLTNAANLAEPNTKGTTSTTNAATRVTSSSTTGSATFTTVPAAYLVEPNTSGTISTASAATRVTSSSATGSATSTTVTAANLIEPNTSGTTSTARATASVTSSSTTTTTASTTLSAANLVGPSPAAEVPITPLVIPNMSQFCAQVNQGNVLADGTQKRTSTCSQTAQGQIPSFDRMVSTLILQPENGAVIQRGSTVPFSCTTSNMETGFFDDPSRLYYATPQTLNSEGIIQGHQHITIQRIATTTVAPDPRSESLAFFVGLNSRADEQGVHTATIPATAFTIPGVYRICTITGTRGHQPVIMPVARRGSQDDCIRVNVV